METGASSVDAGSVAFSFGSAASATRTFRVKVTFLECYSPHK